MSAGDEDATGARAHEEKERDSTWRWSEKKRCNGEKFALSGSARGEKGSDLGPQLTCACYASLVSFVRRTKWREVWCVLEHLHAGPHERTVPKYVLSVSCSLLTDHLLPIPAETFTSASPSSRFAPWRSSTTFFLGPLFGISWLCDRLRHVQPANAGRLCMTSRPEMLWLLAGDHLTQELATLVTDMMLQRFFTIMLM